MVLYQKGGNQNKGQLISYFRNYKDEVLFNNYMLIISAAR